MNLKLLIREMNKIMNNLIFINLFREIIKILKCNKFNKIKDLFSNNITLILIKEINLIKIIKFLMNINKLALLIKFFKNK